MPNPRTKPNCLRARLRATSSTPTFWSRGMIACCTSSRIRNRAALHRAACAELRRVAAPGAAHGRSRPRPRATASRGQWRRPHDFDLRIRMGYRALAGESAFRVTPTSILSATTERPLAEALAAALPALEFALLAGGEDGVALIDEARGRELATRHGSSRSSSACRASDAVRGLVFDSLACLSHVARRRPRRCRGPSCAGCRRPRSFIGTGSCAPSTLRSLLAERLPAAADARIEMRHHAIDAARAMLASLGRETDAIALAYPDGVEWHDVGRGIAVALYAMLPGRRDALDSHIGMMLFKNGLPVGYGGGWPFAGSCRIGVNIFEPFRGGESALLFGQVLHVYRKRFGINRFVVEPSQFGAGNLEGLRSGAFWFYYRLGFRPVEPRAAARAREVHDRMRGGSRLPRPHTDAATVHRCRYRAQDRR